jgi:hypothetical protein
MVKWNDEEAMVWFGEVKWLKSRFEVCFQSQRLYKVTARCGDMLVTTPVDDDANDRIRSVQFG